MKRALLLVLAATACEGAMGPAHDLVLRGPGADTVTPLVDGVETVVAAADVIRGARRFIALAMWALDEDTRLSADTQQPPRADHTAEVRCADMLHDDVIRVVLRCQAARIAEGLAQEARAAGGDGLDARAEVRVMLWSNPFDFSDYNGPQNAAGRLGAISVPWSVARTWSDAQAVAELRALGSGESARWLARVHARYRALRDYDGPAAYPTGIYVVSQADPFHITSSLHLKTLLTERSAIVGGVNLVRESWDNPAHHLRWEARTNSGVAAAFEVLPGTASPFRWPMHDTAVRVGGPALAGVNALMNARWAAAVDDIVPGWGHHPYGPFLQRLRQMQRRATSADLATLQALEAEVLSRERALPRPAAPVADEPAAGGGETCVAEAAAGDVRKLYKRAMSQARGPGGVIYIENQYFSDVELGRALVEATDSADGAEAIILTPYVPDMLRFTPLDVGLPVLGIPGLVGLTARDEMRVLRWMELRSARGVLTRDESGHWVPRGTLVATPGCPAPHLRGAEAMETLSANDPLDIAVAVPVEGGCPRIVPLGPLRVRDVLTESRIHVFTLAADDGLPPTGGSPAARVGAFFHATRSGIYIHSKAAAFLDDARGIHVATAGSANLNPRSLGPGAGEPHGPYDTELNLFFDGEVARRWAVRLADEHTRGRSAGLRPAAWPAAFEAWGRDNLHALADGTWPGPNGTRLVRLDVVERCVELGGC